MATIKDVKNAMLDKLMAMDLNNMSLMDAGQYAFVLKTLSEVNETTTTDALLETMRHVCSGIGAAPVAPMEGFALGYMGGGELNE